MSVPDRAIPYSNVAVRGIPVLYYRYWYSNAMNYHMPLLVSVLLVVLLAVLFEYNSVYYSRYTLRYPRARRRTASEGGHLAVRLVVSIQL